MSVIDAATRAVTPPSRGHLPGRGGGGPRRRDRIRDQRDRVSVIDAATRAVTATIPVGTSPAGVAVDPSTHTVYVATRSVARCR